MVFFGIFPKVLKIFLMFFVLLVIILEFLFFLPDPVCILEYRHLKLLFHYSSFCILHGFVAVNRQLF